MKHSVPALLTTVFLFMSVAFISAQDRVCYTGTELSNPYRHDGQLSPAVGVHNIQLLRANRDSITATYNFGWTYNHQPMMCYWNGKFYLHFLCDSTDEHIPPSRTVLMTSPDGYHWSSPEILFPEYKVPEGFTKKGRTDTAHNLTAIMHQRVGFYVASNGRLLATGNYGIALDRKDDPNDGNGIGRVVREIKKDGTFGPIYFVYYNHDFNEKNTDYPFYTRARDKGFIKACREMMDNPLYRMQMVEEADRNDPMLPLNKPYKAFCYYYLPDDRIVGLWKHALTSISNDGGNTWEEPVERAKGFVNSNAKIWGQKLSDDTYATVYNPAEYRWPLAISLSNDGLEYTTLNLIHGIVPPMRYGGNYKSFGPQYARGIQPGNGTPPDGDLWVSYSVGKEDIWVSHIPVPVRQKVTEYVQDDISHATQLCDLREWNLYTGIATPVTLENKKGTRWLTITDKDPFSFAWVERKIPESRVLKVSFDIMAEQTGYGNLQIDFADAEGIPCARVEFTDSIMRAKGGARYSQMGKYSPGEIYHIDVELSVGNRNYTVYINGKKKTTRMFFAPVPGIERIIFRTGSINSIPTPDTPADQYFDLENAGQEETPATYRIARLRTSGDRTANLLDFNDYRHYIDYFNRMEDENIAQAIPNDQSADWLETNIPLFDCPDRNMEEIYYYRWWTLRKHIKNTPVGYAMTEFLVPRSYADKYNLISSALGHHIHECRWLRDTCYLRQIVYTWYRGNDGKPMERMDRYSSWTPYAIYNSWLVTDDSAFLADLLPDMKREYSRWEKTHRLPNGLYWQSDVQDAMEESISGGRKKQYARPTISSYMYGNAMAIFQACRHAEDADSFLYKNKADTLKYLVEKHLWNESDAFFETRRGDTLANVREAIGYTPWYFNLPTQGKFDSAWLQISDSKGFSAPFGLTTAERRHPQFRAVFKTSCEWNGPIWPFATSQTLTALANYLNANGNNEFVNDSIWFGQLKLYALSHYFHGRPYIGEYLDEVTGYWLKGEQERSRYYNHSTFNDLIITGLVGLRPCAGNTFEINPLLPDDTWDYFCLDNVLYHGRNLTIAWDKKGDRYRQGKGLFVWIDGKLIGYRPTLGPLSCTITFDKQ